MFKKLSHNQWEAFEPAEQSDSLKIWPVKMAAYDNPLVNEDGSVDLFFGQEAPKGKEKKWVKTIPGEGWEILLRLYGPLEPHFDSTWKPDDFVKVD